MPLLLPLALLPLLVLLLRLLLHLLMLLLLGMLELLLLLLLPLIMVEQFFATSARCEWLPPLARLIGGSRWPFHFCLVIYIS